MNEESGHVIYALARMLFERYKAMGDAVIERLSDEQLHARADDQANSVAILMRHIAGNMRSRWTDVLTTDGEKPWRHRDTEFEVPKGDRAALLRDWESGWEVLFATLDSLMGVEPSTQVLIRREPHSLTQALLRQLTHYAYHVGQMVQRGREMVGPTWASLSVPRGASQAFNASLGHTPSDEV